MVKMKDSGIEWIGEIPEKWKAVPIYTCTSEITQKNFDLKEKRALKFTYGNIVDKNNFNIDEDPALTQTASNYLVVKPNDIVINGLNLNYDFVTQRVGMVNNNGIITSAYIGIRTNQAAVIPKYLLYLFKTYDAEKAFHNMGGGVRKILNYSELKKEKVILPSVVQQRFIADFLDKKCTEIDDISVKIQKEIDTLEEYRKSVITKAVTKGLNDQVLMKDSEIGWMGKIPKAWSIVRLKFLGEARNGLTYSPHNMSDESGTLVLRSSNIKNGNIVNADNVYVDEKVPQNLILKKDDLLICSRNGSQKLIGKNALIPEDFAGSSFGAFMCIFRGKYNKYIHYVLNSRIFDFYIGSFLTSTINQLTRKNLYNLSIPFPVKENERKDIINFLDKKCNTIDKLIRDKKMQLNKIQEYKNSMIFEYVTGKKQVSVSAGEK